ncbi:hypothetical protein KIW84_041375 [Lathyrus oleraceus]|uniref:C3H1-type domain-containing protein n=1 Tax=Pisum sativum TaxID=3888 RepID=A0A9D4XA11_PEA|nr:hypothetical protein KIW84_041375 [Pisum sativum]
MAYTLAGNVGALLAEEPVVELQVPGGGIEAEAAVSLANSTKVVIPTLPTGSSANNAPTLPASVSAMTEEEKKAKKELLWKKLNKINRIYDDWIDDISPDLPKELRQPPPNWKELQRLHLGGNRDTSKFMNDIFFKTHLCANFVFRSCRNGENCSYAHGEEELRQSPPNWQELKRQQLGGNRDTAKFMNDSWKTRESSAITLRTIGNNLEGNKTGTKHARSRPLGDDCNYAHGDAGKAGSR